MSQLDNMVQVLEEKDRYITTMMLNDVFKSCDSITLSGTCNQYCPVDMTGEIRKGKNICNLNIEIKSRNKTEYQLLKYPDCELKVSKLKRMISYTDKNTKLLYVVLLNEQFGYIFDCDNIDWEKIEVKDWKIRKRQVDENSEYVIEPTYLIPVEYACKIIDIKPYYHMFNFSKS